MTVRTSAVFLLGIALSRPVFAAPSRVLANRQTVRLPESAAGKADLNRIVPQATLETLPGGFTLCAPAPFTLLPPGEDGRYHQRLTRAVAVYATRTDGSLIRRVTVHFEPDDMLRAMQYARLGARLLRLHYEHFQRDAVFGRDQENADVWLFPGPAPDKTVGGETRGNQVYIWGTQTESRTPLEWTRTLAHEWGHLTLPAARDFREPEGDASGFLGERLYCKWLRDDAPKKANPDDGTTAADLDLYAHRQVNPLMMRWQGGGPASSLLDGTNTEAMDYYIGMVLGSDTALGSRLLGRALFSVLDTHPRDLVSSLTRVVQGTATLTIRLPAWIPLAKGDYQARAVAGNAMVSLGANGSSASLQSDRPVALKITTTGWRYLRSLRGEANQIVLHRVSGAGRGERSE